MDVDFGNRNQHRPKEINEMIDQRKLRSDGISQKNSIADGGSEKHSAAHNSRSNNALSLIDSMPFFNAIKCLFSDGFLAISEIHQQASSAKLATMFEEDEESADDAGNGSDPCGTASWEIGATTSLSSTGTSPLSADYAFSIDQKADQRHSRSRRKKKNNYYRRHRTHKRISEQQPQQQQKRQEQHHRPLAIASGYNALQDIDGRRVIITPRKERSQQVLQRQQLGIDCSPTSPHILSSTDHHVRGIQLNCSSLSSLSSTSSFESSHNINSLTTR